MIVLYIALGAVFLIWLLSLLLKISEKKTREEKIKRHQEEKKKEEEEQDKFH
ncbi:hypothetical protein KAX97_11630 [candidate division WOR-3 bacterium]|nr:hypothetical protein [candidate division WOR-3 bacterium]